MDYTEVLYSKKDHVATLRFNAPERLNSFSPRMTEEFYSAVKEARDDDDVRVLVVTGAGEAFCTGGNAKTAIQRYLEPDQAGKSKKLFELLNVGMTNALRLLDKPAIASINGVATGRGFDITLMCDMRIASERARMSVIYTKRGIVPPVSTYYLPRIVGIGKACELIFTGDMIDALEAKRIGLVDQVTPADQLEETTLDLASRLAKSPPMAMRFAKRAVYKGLELDYTKYREYRMFARYLTTVLSEEVREGFQAFVDKREPVY